MKGTSAMKTKDIAMIALMTVMICLCSWINIALFPVVPFTMQTFGIYCTLLLLGGKRGTIAMLLYLFMAVGAVPTIRSSIRNRRFVNLVYRLGHPPVEL